MGEKLKTLVKKHKRAGKPILIGKVAGGIVGIVAGVFIGKEIPEFLDGNYSDYVLFGMKVPPAFILGYFGQKVGGWTGVGYYFLNRNNKNNSQSL